MMKSLSITFVVLAIALLGCASEEGAKENVFVFSERYCATVTVGGVIGVTERCFEVGDAVTGQRKDANTITIRIAEHTQRNEGPPGSASYQELLDVPSEFLKLRE